MDKESMECSPGNGKSIFIEVYNAGGERNASPNKIKKTFQEAIEIARDAAELAIKQMDGLQNCSENGPQEIDIEFGIKFDSKFNAFLISLGGEANLKVNLKWTKP